VFLLEQRNYLLERGIKKEIFGLSDARRNTSTPGAYKDECRYHLFKVRKGERKHFLYRSYFFISGERSFTGILSQTTGGGKEGGNRIICKGLFMGGKLFIGRSRSGKGEESTPCFGSASFRGEERERRYLSRGKEDLSLKSSESTRRRGAISERKRGFSTNCFFDLKEEASEKEEGIFTIPRSRKVLSMEFR